MAFGPKVVGYGKPHFRNAAVGKGEDECMRTAPIAPLERGAVAKRLRGGWKM